MVKERLKPMLIWEWKPLKAFKIPCLHWHWGFHGYKGLALGRRMELALLFCWFLALGRTFHCWFHTGYTLWDKEMEGLVVSDTLMKHYDQNQVGGEKVYLFGLQFHMIIHHWRKSGQELKQDRNLKAGAEVEAMVGAAYWLAQPAFL